MSSRSDLAHLFSWFLAWIVPGVLLPAGLLFLPFGTMVFWPLAVLAVVLLISLHRPRGPEVLGILVGIAAWAFTVAFFNGDSVPCSEGQTSMTLAPGESFSCGGVQPDVFLVAGILLTLVAIFVGTIWSQLIRSVDRRRQGSAALGP